MSSKYEISIIIPAYNEENRIPNCLKRLLSYCDEKKWDFEILVAEDGSNDNTVKIVNDFITQDPRIKLLSFKERLGKGGAIKNAMLKAEKDNVCFMDVDLSADVKELERLIPHIGEYDVVIGSRLLRDSLPPIKVPIYRKIFSRFYSKFFRFLFRMPILDPQCGFKLFKKNIISSLFNVIDTTGFAFDSEVIVKSYSLQYKIKEVPIIWNFDSGSKVNVFKAVREMGTSLLQLWYDYHMLWLQNKPTYPQKKGSLLARLAFRIFSLSMKSKKIE